MHIEHRGSGYTEVNVGDYLGKTETEARERFAEMVGSGADFINLDDVRGRKYAINRNDISSVEFGYRREPKKK